MKYMKLGSKPDAFVSDGSLTRYVVSELPTDVTVHVGSTQFHLHKFPLLSKSIRLQRLVLRANEDSTDQVFIHDFPGGPKAFEICAKFCYGMTVTLNAYNVVAARCAAEYLEMTEDVEKGNLIFKIEVFLNSSVFRSWKDMIIVLQTTQSLLPWSEELKIVGRCIDSIASKTSVDPTLVNWSYTHSRKWATSNEIVETSQTANVAPKDWWIEDICELDVDLYKRVMVAVKSKGRMSSDLIGEALKAYAVRWLPDSYDALIADDYTKRNRILVETIVSLLPSSECSCRFLLKLLKVVILVGAADELKEDLMNRISMQLHKASAKDLLIPVKSADGTIYDVPLVESLVCKFFIGVGSSCDATTAVKSENKFHEDALENETMLAVGKLIDEYLAEIACDPNLSIYDFIDLSKLIPESARPLHDKLYTAINFYLKEHQCLSKLEKKKICGLIDVKKLSTDACIHAAQNELLPLRLIVQILFFEQLRISACGSKGTANDTLNDSFQRKTNAADDCPGRIPDHQGPLSQNPRGSNSSDEKKKKSRRSYKDKRGVLLLPSRSRRIFEKLWHGKGQGTNKSSNSSGTPPSPRATVKPDETKLSGSSTKHRRYSVS